LSTTKSIKIVNLVNDISNDSKLHGIISDLRNFIDEYNTKSQELVIEIAKRLDEKNLCERSKISQLIKKILKDKIQEGKITKKWIEECLPKEYKRKYAIKSEVSSLSKKEVSITNAGQIIQFDEKNSTPSSVDTLNHSNNDLDNIKTFELEEALQKQQQFVTGDQIFSEETKFFIPKEKSQLINDSLQKSNKGCYVKFDRNKILRVVQLDIQPFITK
jgi:hypothetical protein